MGQLIWSIVGILLAPLTFAFAYEAYLVLTAHLDALITNWFIYGAIAYLAVFLIVPASRMRFIEIFEHELGHTVMAMAFFQDIQKFEVEVNGVNQGAVHYVGTSNFVITLAPYFLPLFTIPLLIIKSVIFSSLHNAIDLLIGFTMAFHYVALLAEFRLSQPDIQKVSLLFALAVTITMNAIFLVVVVSVLLNDYGLILSYLDASLVRTRETYEIVIENVRNWS
jgi:hypothetical protein